MEIDRQGVTQVEAHIAAIRSSGLTTAADLFEAVYWGWLRMTHAYVLAHPYVAKPEPPSMTPISALSVTDFTLKHWSERIPGTPKLDDEAVLREAAVDEAWHRAEDRRMRREAGEDIP